MRVGHHDLLLPRTEVEWRDHCTKFLARFRAARRIRRAELIIKEVELVVLGFMEGSIQPYDIGVHLGRVTDIDHIRTPMSNTLGTVGEIAWDMREADEWRAWVSGIGRLAGLAHAYREKTDLG